jgi:hypothetical protein
LFTEKTRKFSARGIASTVAAAFAAVGLLWVLISDITLYGSSDRSSSRASRRRRLGLHRDRRSARLLHPVRAPASLARDRATIKAVIERTDGVLLLGRDRVSSVRTRRRADVVLR